MSVIGIDFGNESCYVAAAKAGGIETLANDYSLRATPAFVAFAGKKRVLGVAAKNQQVTNMKNTISGFKRLLGRKFSDPQVQHELKTIPFKVEPIQNDGIGIRVNYLDTEHVFTPEQITAMLFTKLKETSETALQAKVNDCVITCPVYFTNAERKALLDAASIAGLNCLRLMNETTATALQYGFYKQDLPDDKPRNVVFVDCGHASLQVSVCSFTKGKLKMLACSWDQIGGRDFDSVLADYFAHEFKEKYKIDAKSNARAYLRLLAEVEKLKKQMSANSTNLPLAIECFMNEIDVSSSMNRKLMEELSAELLMRVDNTLRKCLEESKLTKDEIQSVEIVGGSSRIPAIKTLIEQTFGKHPSTTLNQDESVSRGAALQCAIMSPAVRVREFGVTDIQNYPVKISWEGEGNSQPGELEVFPQFHPAPFSRLLTLTRRQPFAMQISYAGNVPIIDPIIGRWYIKDVRPNDKGEPQDVKVKVRINNHGIVLISNASLVEKKEMEEQLEQESKESSSNNGEQQASTQPEQQQPNTGTEPMEVSQEDYYDDGNHGSINDTNCTTPTADSSGGLGLAQRFKGWFTSGASVDKKKKSKLIELSFDYQTHGFSQTELTKLHEQEIKMISNDEHEKQRVDARNSLEEYVYDMREKLQEDGPLSRFVTEHERTNICSQLNDLENWLYEEGEDCDRDTYKNKLSVLHQQTDPIKQRCHEYESQPAAFEELGHLIQMTRKAVDEYRHNSPKYDHLTETEILNITEAAEKTEKWLNDAFGRFTTTPRTQDPPFKYNDIRNEWQTLSTCVNSVLSRPKPKTPTPPSSANKQNDQTNGEVNTNNTNSDNKQSQQNSNTFGEGDKPSNHVPEDSTMEVE